MVFFPHTLLPLHIFEPRYRAMLERCIVDSSPLAIVMIEPGHEGEQPGDPPIVEVASVGELVFHEKLPDGRFHIVLRGLARVTLEEVPSDDPYRIARAAVLADRLPDDTAALVEAVAALRVCIDSLVHRWPRTAETLRKLVQDTDDGAILADRLTPLIFHDPLVRQELLCCVNVAERVARVLDRLTGILAGTSTEAVH
jgi:hypothetical protein